MKVAANHARFDSQKEGELSMNVLSRKCGSKRNGIEVKSHNKRNARNDRQPRSIVTDQHLMDHQRLEVQADAEFIAS